MYLPKHVSYTHAKNTYVHTYIPTPVQYKNAYPVTIFSYNFASMHIVGFKVCTHLQNIMVGCDEVKFLFIALFINIASSF